MKKTWPQTVERNKCAYLRWPREPTVRLGRRQACLTDRFEAHVSSFDVWRKAWERPCGLVGAAGIVAQHVSVYFRHGVQHLSSTFDDEPFSTRCVYILAFGHERRDTFVLHTISSSAFQDKRQASQAFSKKPQLRTGASYQTLSAHHSLILSPHETQVSRQTVDHILHRNASLF
jgi:hypothetical protein